MFESQLERGPGGPNGLVALGKGLPPWMGMGRGEERVGCHPGVKFKGPRTIPGQGSREQEEVGASSAGYKINAKKPLAFLHTNNERSEREIKEKNPFTIAT